MIQSQKWLASTLLSTSHLLSTVERFVTLTVFTSLSNNCTNISYCQRTKRSRSLLHKQLLIKSAPKIISLKQGESLQRFCLFWSVEERIKVSDCPSPPLRPYTPGNPFQGASSEKLDTMSKNNFRDITLCKRFIWRTRTFTLIFSSFR